MDLSHSRCSFFFQLLHQYCNLLASLLSMIFCSVMDEKMPFDERDFGSFICQIRKKLVFANVVISFYLLIPHENYFVFYVCVCVFTRSQNPIDLYTCPCHDETMHTRPGSPLSHITHPSRNIATPNFPKLGLQLIAFEESSPFLAWISATGDAVGSSVV